ncbi:MAG: leucyl/phenylalanyl-tRNA--protein transferase [Flavobacteriales bacterium]|nr:leucyl/phenylalanyl-tRNA--protein transferase [Flavobacteriales bacterium]
MSLPSRSPDAMDPRLLLQAYTLGMFPMGDADGRIQWYLPRTRAVFPLLPLPIPRSVQALRRSGRFLCTHDREFERVMRACADRPSTWITEAMITAYGALHRSGHAHSVEVWENGELVGGLYGVHIGSAFFGESMFHRRPNASRFAFHHTHEHLIRQCFKLHDAQLLNPFTGSLGAREMERDLFEQELRGAISIHRPF